MSIDEWENFMRRLGAEEDVHFSITHNSIPMHGYGKDIDYMRPFEQISVDMTDFPQEEYPHDEIQERHFLNLFVKYLYR